MEGGGAIPQRWDERLCEPASWRRLLCEASCLGFGHHSCITSSDGAAASIFNGYRDTPECSMGNLTTDL